MLTWFSVLQCSIGLAQSDVPDGNGSMRGRFGDFDIVITTTARLAGAIHSLTLRSEPRRGGVPRDDS
ncbi:MAG: hypothetical protein DWI22_14440 [Planctomycetota bacterium]|nr:MAG: hypothetical protein DWI22_14440 [Planctomycetota bacterium]